MDIDSENIQSTLVQQLRYPSIHGYRLGEEIGGGGFSKVFRAINDQSSSVAACKVVNLYISPTLGCGTPNVKELQKEVQVHKAMKHDYILEFLHSEIVDKDKEEEGWVPGLYMLLELAIGGDLFDKIAPDVGIPEDLAKFYFAQMVQGIDHIHQRGIAHRDLKPENLLLAANGNLKISDFGLCAVFKHKGKTRLLSGRCGSLPYVAPELGGQTGYAAEPVDIWGMGVVLYTMLVGNTPWDEPSEKSPEFMAYLSQEIFDFDPWTRIRGQARAILLGMLNPDPNARFTMQDIKTHKWSMTMSQLTREQIPDALTQGMKSNGMWAVADPVFASQASQTHAMERSQRMTNSQWTSQLNQQESQFMRGTGNITQSGDYNSSTTRFWLSLFPADALALLNQYLVQELGSENVQVENQRGNIRVQKLAQMNKRGETQSVEGMFVIRGSDSLSFDGAQSLVVMRRAKGSILRWRAFWWSIVRSQHIEPYVIKGDT